MQHGAECLSAPPCIWMSAGLVRYQLCPRELDCEHCPLDAALRGEPSTAWNEEELASVVPKAAEFPADRWYSLGHCWLRPLPGGSGARLGVDALAATLVGTPRRVLWAAPAESILSGASLCTLDLPYGALPLGSPAAGQGVRPNLALERDPELMVRDPYQKGWLVELGEATERLDLLDAQAMRERAGLDLRRFRRLAALHLLADAEEVGPTLADGGQVLTDLRLMLGPQRYLALVRDLVY